jgi:potassium-transporting ATPase ATP-binding subunit
MKHIFSRQMLLSAFITSFTMLSPKIQWKNPVMFVTYLGAILTTLSLFSSISWFAVQIALWLWFTVFFANFALGMAEARGKAQALALRKTQVSTTAKKLEGGTEVVVRSDALQKGDVIVCRAGDHIPADGDVIEGIATVDESAITGESAPVI